MQFSCKERSLSEVNSSAIINSNTRQEQTDFSRCITTTKHFQSALPELNRLDWVARAVVIVKWSLVSGRHKNNPTKWRWCEIQNCYECCSVINEDASYQGGGITDVFPGSQAQAGHLTIINKKHCCWSWEELIIVVNKKNINTKLKNISSGGHYSLFEK